MASNEDIIKEANYYLENDVTIEQASHDLGVSKRTLQLHLKKLESIAPDTFKLVTDKKLSNERQGRIKGGTLGKRTPTWEMDEVSQIAEQMLSKEMTYREAEGVFNIPKSTLHDMLHNSDLELDTTSLLYVLSEANKRGISVEEFKQRHKDEHIATDIVAKSTKENEMYGKRSK